MFIPATLEECKKLNWQEIDVILITGDSYIDSSYSGIAIIGKYLIKNGFKVAIIPQPTLTSSIDILRFGNPKLFWGITAGAMDSMVANYTATKKPRKFDDLTAGGINNKRPNRAIIKYVNLVKQFAEKTKPIVIGGIEASLRRLAHYDYWDNKIRKSILLDSKADILVYGEGEKTILEIANNIKNNTLKQNLHQIKGICYISNTINEIQHKEHIILPAFAQVENSQSEFTKMFNIFYQNNDPINAKGLIQQFDNRFIIQNPPNNYLENQELDEIYELDFENNAHPIHQKHGLVKGLETTMFSITTHRGCFGECNFCSIAIHQGRKIRSRSEKSIIAEVKKMTNDKRFKGNINDLGGATANMYKMECPSQIKNGSCQKKRCMFPNVCKSRNTGHLHHLDLIKKVLQIKEVKRVFINSGLRYDLIQNDKIFGKQYLEFIVNTCVSGQMKIAPEHTSKKILDLMAKPKGDLVKFCNDFYTISRSSSKEQYLTFYLLVGHPGCAAKEMREMSFLLKNRLRVISNQVQIFTPTPSTYSTLMYYTNRDWINNEDIFVETNPKNLQQQKNIVISKSSYDK